MSDIFESDIDDEDENLAELEDEAEIEEEGDDDSDFTPNKPIYHLKFPYSRESLFATAGKFDIKAGSRVIVPSRYGRDMAVVLGETKKPYRVRQIDIIQIDRVATAEDLKRAEELQAKEAGAFDVFKEKVAVRRLDMKLISVHFLVAEPKALFFFSADNRIDFRELVKDLVAVFKMRIELRQIGVRDESRITGGIGICGRPCCCHAVSDKIRPVSIRMAKEQNLSLNSSKISGQCGRLLCCLSYEHDWYCEARKRLPAEGIRLAYDGTNFKITEVNPLSSMIKMLGEDGRLLEVNAKRFVKGADARWRVD